MVKLKIRGNCTSALGSQGGGCGYWAPENLKKMKSDVLEVQELCFLASNGPLTTGASGTAAHYVAINCPH